MILRDQINIAEQNVAGYKRLLDGENEKFLFGESSVFLLNKRQEKYIQSQLKVVSLLVKLGTERLNYLYYTNGLLSE